MAGEQVATRGKPWNTARCRRAGRAGTAALAAGLVGSVLVVAPALPPFSAAGAATIDDVRCAVEPVTSTGTQSGVIAVAPGETVTVAAEVDLPAGWVYQDLVTDPGGATTATAWVGVSPSAELAVADPASITFTIDDVPQPLTTGTAPAPDAFVLDTSGPQLRVYFPGDPAALAAPGDNGVPSYEVPATGQTFRLSYGALVPDEDPGTVLPAASCQAATADGSSNGVSAPRDIAVGVLGLEVTVDKTADLPVLAPSTVVTYSVDVVVPATDAAGELRNGTAYDTVVTDTLPAGLDYVPGSASDGGVEAAGVVTWTLPTIAAGSTVTLTYQMAVPADAAPGATFVNDVEATTTSQPGVITGERTTAPVTDSVTLMIGGTAPAITKSASPAVAGPGQEIDYTVDIVWPADSTWHDVTLTDLLPDGTTLADAGTLACTPGPCPAFTNLSPATDAGGNTRFGNYVADQVGPFAAAETWHWTYTARMEGTFSGGAAVPLSTPFDNLAEVRFNLIPRLGGATPNPARLVGFDGLVGDTATVVFDRPVLAIDKVAPSPDDLLPGGITYTVTLTNSGGVDAVNATFTDPGPTSNGYRLGAIQAASVTGATYAAATSTFTVASIPAGQARTVTYRVAGAAAEAVAVAADYVNTATITAYRDPAGNAYSGPVADSATVTVEQPAVTVVKDRTSASPIAGLDGERITYRVTVTNTGDATAYNIAGTDAPTFGHIIPGACTGGMTLSAAGQLAVAELVVGATASCAYDIELDGDQVPGQLVNTATITWRNAFGQASSWTAAGGIRPWTASDTATTAVVAPQLVVEKLPDATTAGNVIVNGGTASYTLSLTNTGTVPVTSIVANDTLPAGLTLNAMPTVQTTPAGVAHTVTGATGAASFRVDVPALQPGEVVRITIPVRHDGVEPPQEQLVNTASVTAAGIAAPITDTGVLVWAPNVEMPVVSKSVLPTSAGPGEVVTWTVNATVRQNSADLYDVTIVDTLPRGLAFTAYGTATCLSGPLCATTPTPASLAPSAQSTGETRLGWFIGDVPGGTADTVYQFTFTATIASTYEGPGTPPAGTQVTDTFFTNRAQAWLNTTPARDAYEDGSLPPLGGSLTGTFERRGAAALADVRAVTPKVVATKTVTNLGAPFTWSTERGSGTGWTAEAGDSISYSITYQNVGAATAYDVDVVDSMGVTGTGSTMLRNPVITAPAGVTITDDWTLADPDVAMTIAQLAPNESVIVTYTGTVAPSAELVPGFSGDNRDVALIRNTVNVADYNSAPAGAGTAYPNTYATGADVYVYTPSPYLTGSACVGGASAPANTTATFTAIARNGAPPLGRVSGTLLTTGYPPDTTVGTGHGAVLTIVLDPNVRYVAGTSRLGAAPTTDPTSTIDPVNGRQTLTYALGDMPQNSQRGISFQVRTTVDGAAGGMQATLTMADASGATARGTAVTGADYDYRNAIARGCEPGAPLRLRKFPDLAASYEGKKQYKPGEIVEWFGDVTGGGGPYRDGELLDRLPDGLEYSAGSMQLTVTRANGSTVAVSVANGNLTEVVTPLADGRTELRFTSPELTAFRSFTYRLSTVVSSDALVGGTLTNALNLTVADIESTNCGDPAISVCDNGSIQVISSAAASVVKTADITAGPYGSVVTYTVDVTLPGNIALYDAYIGDFGTYPRALDPNFFTTYAASAITCLAGCSGDPAPSAMPVSRNNAVNGDFARAWYLGDLALRVEPRIYRLTYRHTFVDQNEYRAAFNNAAPPAQLPLTNTARAGWNDTNVRNDAAFRTGGASFNAAGSRTLAVLTTPRAADQATVTLVRPDMSVTKECRALDGREDLVAERSLGGETTGSTPNFRCTLTATNTTDPAIGTPIIDPVLVDTLPTQSGAPGTVRPIATQFIAASSDEALIDVTATEVPGSTTTPPQASSLRITADGLELAPGESVSVRVDLRVTAAPEFWTSADPVAYSVNTLRANAFGDLAGNAYVGTSVDTWGLAIEKPRVTVSERAWVGEGYEQQLADGLPTACMAYALRSDPVRNVRLFGDITVNPCAELKDARRHESLPGGDYARSYGGGAPDVVVGTDQRVTWAVDTAVTRPADLSTITVAERIPYGFEYVPGSARLAHWTPGTGTTHSPFGDPVIGSSTASCSTALNFAGGSLAANFIAGQTIYGQEPGTPLTWTFARGASGPAGAFWQDQLSYLDRSDRALAGALDTATPFDRLVRVVFDVRPTAEFAACLQRPGLADTFRSAASATAAAAAGSVASSSLGWVVGVQLAGVTKTPDGAIAADGATVEYGIDVTINDPVRIDRTGTPPGTSGINVLNVPSGAPCGSTALPAPPARVWAGLGDLSRNGGAYEATYVGTSYHTGFSSLLVVTDVLPGPYTSGSATIEMLDPWGRPFTGHLLSEDVVPVTVDGRPSSQITWTFDFYPSPVNVGTPTATFPCPTDQPVYGTYPSSVHIDVPLAIPDGVPDGTPYPNTASARVNHIDDGALVRTQGAADDALIIARNPLPPPPTTKVATPVEVAPGATFDWVVEAQLEAGGVWFDLGWTDVLPAGMELVGYGTPTCVLTGVTPETPCPAPALTPTTLTPVANADGSTTLGWWAGDLSGTGAARTVRMPLTVRFTGDEVAGDVLTNTVTGFSNDDDVLATPTTPQDPATFALPGTPVVGQATVVEPALTVAKDVVTAGAPYQAGDTVGYEVTVTNNGTAPAYDVVVTDTPDASLTTVTTPSALRSKGWTAADPRLEWFIPSIGVGETVTLPVSGIVSSGYVALGRRELANTATLSDYTARPVSTGGGRAYPGAVDQVVVPLVAPNLTVTKFAGVECDAIAQVYAPNGEVGWCVAVANTGDATSYNVTLTDLLPPDWAYQVGSAEVDGEAVEPSVSSAPGGERLLWSLGDLEPEAQRIITYTTTGDDGSELVTNTAIVDSTLENGDPVPGAPPGFRARSEAFAAALGAGLQIAKLPDRQTVACDPVDGCALTWQILLVNADQLALTGATVTDLLPADLIFGDAAAGADWTAVVGASGSGASGTTPVTWTHTGTFASGSVAEFAITALVPGQPTTARSFLNHAAAVADGVPEVANQAIADVYTPVSLGNRVWEDVDRDGRQDGGEPGVPGATVELYDGGGALVRTTVTDAAGLYLFTGLAPGAYRVRVLVPAEWQTTAANVGDVDSDSDVDGDGWSAPFLLSSGVDDLSRDAGLLRPPPGPEPTTTTTPPDPTAPTTPAPTTSVVTPQPPAPTAPPSLVPPGELPATGGDSQPLILLALALLALGVGAVLLTTRRRRRPG